LWGPDNCIGVKFIAVVLIVDEHEVVGFKEVFGLILIPSLSFSCVPSFLIFSGGSVFVFVSASCSFWLDDSHNFVVERVEGAIVVGN
jgi:hypothetical protein